MFTASLHSAVAGIDNEVEVEDEVVGQANQACRDTGDL